jgi:hypothetical protein
MISAAHGNSECDFAEPHALLQKSAYRAYTFQRTPDNGASESTEISEGVHLEVQQSQCVDFLVRTFTLTVESSITAQPLDIAIKEISNIQFSDLSEKPTELLSFLKTRHGRDPRANFSACKDGSSAPLGECTWESGGGFSFEVSRKKKQVIISATEYTSG